VNQNKLDSSSPSQVQGALPIPGSCRSCNRCGEVMAIVRTMLNSTTGKPSACLNAPAVSGPGRRIEGCFAPTTRPSSASLRASERTGLCGAG